ncbi:MAG: hypothetical protein ABSE73_22065 [Planctomycetota bacterium]
MASARELLATIKEAAERLNRTSESATAHIVELDKFLAANSPGVEVWLHSGAASDRKGGLIRILEEEVTNAEQHKVNGYYILGYARCEDGELGIAVASCATPSGQQWVTSARMPELLQVKRLSKAPRHVKIAAMEHMQEFLAQLAWAAKKAASDAENATVPFTEAMNPQKQAPK